MDQDVYLTKVLQAEDGNLFLLGRAGNAGWVAKIDGAGKTLWERDFGSAGVAALVDGVQTDDKDLLLLGSYNSSTFNPTSWVGKLNGRGDLLIANRLSGSGQSISGSAEGMSVVVGDRRGPEGREVWAKGLTANLVESWSTVVLSRAGGVFPFKVAAVSSGGWVVAGSGKDNLPTMTRVSKSGGVMWTYTHRYAPNLIPLMGRFDLLSSGQELILAFTLDSLNKNREQRQTVRIVKFTVK
jgi:hypothetical protein